MESLKAYEMNLNNAKPPYLINVKPLAHIVVYIPWKEINIKFSSAEYFSVKQITDLR